MTRYPHLFSPLALGPLELNGRIVSTSHQTSLVHAHLPTAELVAYHEARARGGVALILLEATAVHPSGLLTPHTLGGYLPEIVDGYGRLVDVVRPHGTRLGVQLFHGGREQITSPPRAPAVAPSAVPSGRFRVEPRALRASEVDELVEGYATAARLAAEGGLDAVEVTAAHGYLLEQFLDAELNRRDDAWADGEVLVRGVLRAVRREAPGLALGIRVSADSPRAALLAELALSERVDYLSAALGRSSSYLGSSLIVPPPPVDEEVVAVPAGRLGRAVPLIVTSRIVDVGAAERLVASGLADAVGMTRALIADPDLPAKARGGGDPPIRCIGCNVCIAHYHAGTPIACAVNPRTGRELTLARTARARRPLRIVVVGAGPAGLAAAAEARRAGHEVVVLERDERSGGQLALALGTPGGDGVARAFLESHRSTDVRLGVDVTPEAVAAHDPDVVLVCTGARPYEPSLHPLAGMAVRQAWDVLRDDRSRALPAAGSAVVADWGGDPSGLDAAELLAARGLDVTLAVASVSVGETVHQYRRNLYLQRLYRAGVTLLHHQELRRAEDGEAVFANAFAPERETRVAAGLLVLALGRVPNDELAAALREAGHRVEEAGDCLGPRSLEEAILEGVLAIRRLDAPGALEPAPEVLA